MTENKEIIKKAKQRYRELMEHDSCCIDCKCTHLGFLETELYLALRDKDQEIKKHKKFISKLLEEGVKARKEKQEIIDEGITSLKRIQANLPITDPALQNREKVDCEIKRLQKLL